MRLLDQMAGSHEPVVVQDTGRAAIWRFPSAGALAPALADCPLRYVLHDDVTATCARLAFADDTILGSSLELVRVPAPKLWVEFRRSARNDAFADVERLALGAEQNSGQRIGILVTADEKGRAGTMQVCWEHPGGLSPELAPFIVEYDFSDASFSTSGSDDGGTCLGASITDFPAIQPLYDRVRFRLRPEWQRYYRQKAGGRAQYQSLLLAAVRPLLEDVPLVALLCLLLASGGAIRQVPVQRTQLNAARARRGRAALLDHVEVSMHLISEDTDGESRGEARSLPRLHFVRGHLVRRGGSIHWRIAHLRGNATCRPILSRTVSLKFAAPERIDRPLSQAVTDALLG